MFTSLRQMMKLINAASPAEVEGRVMIVQSDGEIAAMTQAVNCGADTALVAVARAPLHALKEAAIAARALRPENIRFSGALACLQQGAVFAPLAGQMLARVA